MSLEKVWVPQNESMTASADIPNMLADAIIQNEKNITKINSDFKKIEESNGVSIFEFSTTFGDDDLIIVETTATFEEIYSEYLAGKNMVVARINIGHIVSLGSEMPIRLLTLQEAGISTGMTFVGLVKENIVAFLHYSHNGKLAYEEIELASKSHIDNAIQSAIYDSWGDAV